MGISERTSLIWPSTYALVTSPVPPPPTEEIVPSLLIRIVVPSGLTPPIELVVATGNVYGSGISASTACNSDLVANVEVSGIWASTSSIASSKSDLVTRTSSPWPSGLIHTV